MKKSIKKSAKAVKAQPKKVMAEEKGVVEQPVKKHGVQGLFQEFKDFLAEYKILGIAAGLVIGSAVTTFVQSIVVGVVTPALQLLIPSEGWKSLVYDVNGVKFQVGLVISASINFLVIALLFFIFVKAFLRKDKVTKI